MLRKLLLSLSLTVLLVIFCLPQPALAMHIMEGFLPPIWSLVWSLLAVPFVIVGFISIRKKVEANPRLKMLLALAGAFTFVLSALKLPSVTGSCSHPTGVGLGAILFGATTMSVLGLIVLLFQALLLAHGGLTTLGANLFSMAVVGPITAWIVYRAIRKLKGPTWLSVFLAACLADLLTYVTTSVQLALAFPDPAGRFGISLAKFLGIFALTQVPLAVSEGILTVLVFNALLNYSREELRDLAVLSEEVGIRG